MRLPDGSGVNREVHAPFCERPEVKVLRPTRPVRPGRRLRQADPGRARRRRHVQRVRRLRRPLLNVARAAKVPFDELIATLAVMTDASNDTAGSAAALAKIHRQAWRSGHAGQAQVARDRKHEPGRDLPATWRKRDSAAADHRPRAREREDSGRRRGADQQHRQARP